MFRWIVLIIIIIPVVELAGLITVGNWIGTLPTVGMIIFTGVVGAWLARREGLRTWKLATLQLNRGEMPGDTLLDGILILLGGAFLITPGFFTDVAGFLMVLPYTRSILRHLMKRWIARKLDRGEWVWFGGRR